MAPASLAACSAQVGAASERQSFSVSGTGLTGPVNIAAPAGYELAAAPAGAYAPTPAITPAPGTVAVVYVRMGAAPAPGTPAGTVAVSSPGSIIKTVAVTGT